MDFNLDNVFQYVFREFVNGVWGDLFAIESYDGQAIFLANLSVGQPARPVPPSALGFSSPSTGGGGDEMPKYHLVVDSDTVMASEEAYDNPV